MKDQGLRIFGRALIRRCDMFLPDAAYDPPDRENSGRHEQRGGERNVDRHAFVMRAFDELNELPDHVVTDRRDRETFDRRLQS